MKPEKTLKNSKPERNPKNPRKKLEKNLKEIHLQNSMGTRTRPETRWIQMTNFTHEFRFRCQIQPDYIFSRVRFSINPIRTQPVTILAAGQKNLTTKQLTMPWTLLY
jgi:hypothetical protein